MHLFHCWHEVEGSIRKIPYKSKCKLEKQPQFIHSNRYINFMLQYKCCICGKVKESPIYREYNIERAMLYKTK